METSRFDTLSRSLASRLSRRAALRTSALAGAVGLAAVAGRPSIAQETTPAASPATGCVGGSEADNEAVVRRWYDEVLNGRNLDILDDIVAEDAGHDVSVLPDAQSREETRQVLGTLLDAYPDLQITLEQVISVDDQVVTRWTATGTQQGPLGDYAATGETVSFTGINIFQLACGQIIASRSVYDNLTQLGLDPARTEPIAPSPAGDGTPESCASSSPEANLELAAEWFDIWNEQDLDRYEDITAPETVHHWAFGNDTVGIDALRERVQSFITAFPDLYVTIDDRLADDDLVVLTWTINGTNDGEFFGTAATGKEATWSGINIYRISCGRVIESWSESDGLSVFAQLSGDATPSA